MVRHKIKKHEPLGGTHQIFDARQGYLVTVNLEKKNEDSPKTTQQFGNRFSKLEIILLSGNFEKS